MTMRAISSVAPALASMFERRSLAASRCSPQKHVERQVAVAVVEAVEEAAFLVAVDRIVRGVQIER